MTNSSNKPLERPKRPDAITKEAIVLYQARKQQQAQTPEPLPQPQPQPEALPQPQIRSQQPPPQEPEKSEKPKHPKPLPLLDSATNATDDVFTLGDKIMVSAPWGGRAAAEIVNLYADNSGSAWATYKPLVAKPGWTWVSGCVRAVKLQKV